MKIHKLPLLFALVLTCSGTKHKSQNQLSGIKVPEGYEISVAAGPNLVDFPMFGTVDELGRLFLFESVGNVYDKSEDAIKNPQFRINL